MTTRGPRPGERPAVAAAPPKYRPPLWESNRYGEPFGRFHAAAGESKSTTTAPGFLGDDDDDDDAASDAVWKRLRAAYVSRHRAHHRKEGGVVLDAMQLASNDDALCTRDAFKAAWATLGVPQLTDAEVAAVFKRVGHDAKGRVPHEVFVRALVLGDGRVMGKEEIRDGPFADARASTFLGKIRYPQSRGGVYPPSDWLSRAVATTKRSASTPAATLELDFAHGFPGRDNLANTLHVSKHGDAVYYLASMGVVYDAKKHRQRFFRGHDDDVRCIAAHPDGITFATGQDGAKPCACVWTAGDECDPRCVEVGRVVDPIGYLRSMVALAFSPEGDRLITVGSDDKHTVMIWDWRAPAGARPLHTMVGIQAAVPAVWGVAWNPFAPVEGAPEPTGPLAKKLTTTERLAALGGEFVTHGEKHVKVWRKGPDGRFAGKMLSFNSATPFNAHSAIFLPGKDPDPDANEARGSGSPAAKDSASAKTASEAPSVASASTTSTSRVTATATTTASATKTGTGAAAGKGRMRTVRRNIVAVRARPKEKTTRGKVLVGCADGRLALFDANERKLIKFIDGAHVDLGEAPSVQRPQRPNTKGVRCLTLLPDEGVVVSAGADGRVLTWRLTPSGDDVEDSPEEEIVLTSPYGKDAPPPRIRALAVLPRGANDAAEVATEEDAKASTSRSVAASNASKRTNATKNASAASSASAPPPPPASNRAFFIGTSMCDLWEVTATKARIRIGGSSNALNDVAWNPKAPSVCATVGADGCVKVFDAASRSQLAVANVTGGIGPSGRAHEYGGAKRLHFSPDGKLLAVGLGDGRVKVLDARTLAFVTEAQACGGGIDRVAGDLVSAKGARVSCLAFSPDSTLLAVAGADRLVHVYANVDGKFTSITTCAGHSTTINSLDWSRDARILRSTCQNMESLCWNVPSGKPRGADVRDVRWHTHTALVGFPVMGMWEDGHGAASDINTADRSRGGAHLATGDDRGDVRLLHYPCVAKGAPCRRHSRAHSSHVRCVLYKSVSPISRFQHLIAPPFN
jgi:WD40 repeat protein